MIREVLFGIAVGDALGVPVEFDSRSDLAADPVTGMRGYGTHTQPPGTFSDDSSLSFCQAEALLETYTLRKLADNFINWYFHDYWTPWGKRFDQGNTTSRAIERLQHGFDPVMAGGLAETDNGNGSLMRILPLLFFVRDKPLAERFRHIKESSSLTHAHTRCVICCFYYLEYARLLAAGENKFAAYRQTNITVRNYLETMQTDPAEMAKLQLLWNGDIDALGADSISGSGYVVHSLEASVWCLLTTDGFDKAVLRAVNLGDDTDTTGAVTGGLAGLLYGIDKIPSLWVNQLARKEDISDLAERLRALFPDE